MDPMTISALAQGAGSLVSSLFNRGGGSSIKKLPNYNQDQNQLLSQLIAQLTGQGQQGYGDAMGLLQKYMDPESQENLDFEEPYMRQFNEQTIPGLAERFAGAGALSSSGFGQSLSAAGGALQSDLASQKRNRMQQSLKDFLGQYNQQSQLGLSAQPFSYVNRNRGQGGGLMSALGGGLQGTTPGMVSGFQNMFGK